jgi:hypothetical protein
MNPMTTQGETTCAKHFHSRPRLVARGLEPRRRAYAAPAEEEVSTIRPIGYGSRVWRGLPLGRLVAFAVVIGALLGLLYGVRALQRHGPIATLSADG